MDRGCRFPDKAANRAQSASDDFGYRDDPTRDDLPHRIFSS
jgi:hypothetical protein